MEARPIFDANPAAPSCHAATIAEAAPGRLLAAWFAGTYEGHRDVAIWMSVCQGGRWCPPHRVADDPAVSHFNPVLFRHPNGGIWLFYKVGPSVPAWSGLYLTSSDAGASWAGPMVLPAGLVGPAKNKPITLSNGDILCGSSSEAWQNWACWIEASADGGATWERRGPIAPPGGVRYERGGGRLVSAVWDEKAQTLLVPQDFPGVIQPALWEHAPGRVTMVMRSTGRIGRVCVSRSEDYGRTWSPARQTAIENPNSGLDAARLEDGRIVLACNPVSAGRSPLSLLVSEDDGETWSRRMDLETGEGEFSYPAIIQASDGPIHVVATHRRDRIVHYVIAPKELG